MGNTINKVDEGLFICGVGALEDTDQLEALGIKYILNAANMSLYNSQLRTRLTTCFEVKCLEAADSAGYNLSKHFDEIADFVEEGRNRGGVVVHCAAGVSRAATSICAYLMAKEGLDLNSAYAKIFACRNVVFPNAGFWQQLRDFEAALVAQSRNLISTDPEEPPVQPNGKPAVALDRAKLQSQLAKLDFQASDIDVYIGAQGPMHFLTAKVSPTDGVLPEALCQQLYSSMAIPGCELDTAVAEGDVVALRLRCMLTMDSSKLKHLLEIQPNIASVVCETGAQEQIDLRASVPVTGYSWADCGAKVKIYIPLAEGALTGVDVASILEKHFSEKSLDLLIRLEPQQRLRLKHLAGEVDPAACTALADQRRGRVVVTLVKKHGIPWATLVVDQPL